MAKVIALPKTKHKPTYKYTLNEQINALPRNTTIDDIIIHLKKEGITKNEFYYDRNILLDSASAIPEDRLTIYAQVFDVTEDELRNYTIKAKSIRQANIKINTRLA